MLHHLVFWVPDLARADESWQWVLGQLGYERDGTFDDRLIFRHPDGVAIALEQSADMVPGMLYSRMRPGLNHMAFRVASPELLGTILQGATAHGWSPLPSDRHPIAPGNEVVYLEDRDGFEIELVAPTHA
ncbi:MAG: VOC family protein [Acidimicrobiia bacterium]|nr:VOC family protein [Acidimicrobiia bacterium]